MLTSCYLYVFLMLTSCYLDVPYSFRDTIHTLSSARLFMSHINPVSAPERPQTVGRVFSGLSGAHWSGSGPGLTGSGSGPGRTGSGSGPGRTGSARPPPGSRGCTARRIHNHIKISSNLHLEERSKSYCWTWTGYYYCLQNNNNNNNNNNSCTGSQFWGLCADHVIKARHNEAVHIHNTADNVESAQMLSE